MSYLLYAASVTTGLLKRNSYLVIVCLLIIDWIFIAFASGNADAGIYESRYRFYELYEGSSEFGWQALMVFFNAAGVEYQTFRMIVTAFELALIVVSTKRVTGNVAFVFAAYAIYPMIMDVVQARFTLAMCIAYFGMTYLIDTHGTGLHVGAICRAKFAAAILLASSIHFVSILFLTLLLVEKLESAKGFLLMFAVSTLFFALCSGGGVLSFIANAVGVGEKFSTLRDYAPSAQYRAIFRIAIYAAMWIVIFWLCKSERSHLKSFGIRMNLLMLTLVPLILISVDFYRVQQGITLLNYAIAGAMIGDKRPSSFIRENPCFIALVVLSAAVNLHLLVLGNSNIETVFWPFFEQNTVLGG